MTGNTAPLRWRVAIDVLGILTAFAIILSGWALYTRFSSNKETWHAVICSLEKETLNDPFRSPQDKRARIQFFEHLLTEDVRTRGCDLL